MKARLHAFTATVVALTLTTPPNTDRNCRVASERREAAVSQVIDAPRTYEKYVLSDQKRNDCAEQLDELDSLTAVGLTPSVSRSSGPTHQPKMAGIVDTRAVA